MGKAYRDYILFEGTTAFGDKDFGYFYEDNGGAFKTNALVEFDGFEENDEGVFVDAEGKSIDDYITEEITHDEFVRQEKLFEFFSNDGKVYSVYEELYGELNRYWFKNKDEAEKKLDEVCWDNEINGERVRVLDYDEYKRKTEGKRHNFYYADIDKYTWGSFVKEVETLFDERPEELIEDW